jgi:ubiquinone biosynthesis protein
MRRTGRIWTLWHFIRIVGVFGRIFLLTAIVPRRLRPNQARSVRSAFERLGATWIKLGQWLSLRFDLLPATYCREFLAIHSEATPLPFDDFRDIFKLEFGRCPEHVFTHIEREPFIATVLHQLHKAQSRDHDDLVVKVQRPGIARIVAADLWIMRRLARVIDFFRWAPNLSMHRLVEDFALSATNEIDYRVPARIIQLASQLSSGDRTEADVTIVPQYSGRRILTTKLIDGILLLDILTALRSGSLHELAEAGLDLEVIARRIHWNMLNQVYREGLFHADVTPTSIMILPDNAIAYVDFGMMGRLPEDVRNSVQFFMSSVFFNRTDRAIDELVRWCTPSDSTDWLRFRDDIAKVIEDYLDGFRSEPGSPPRQATSQFGLNVMTTLWRHRLTVPNDISLYLRALLTTDTIVFELCPEFDLPGAVGRFFARATALDAADALSPLKIYENIVQSVYSASQLVQNVSNLQKAGSALEISLRTLKVRLFEYALWGLLATGAGYAVYTGGTFVTPDSALGLGQGWVAGALFLFALVFFFKMLRQGRRLATMDHTTVTRSDVSLRSRGRVR